MTDQTTSYNSQIWFKAKAVHGEGFPIKDYGQLASSGAGGA